LAICSNHLCLVRKVSELGLFMETAASLDYRGCEAIISAEVGENGAVLIASGTSLVLIRVQTSIGSEAIELKKKREFCEPILSVNSLKCHGNTFAILSTVKNAIIVV
jgi:hypothetical protein